MKYGFKINYQIQQIEEEEIHVVVSNELHAPTLKELIIKVVNSLLEELF